MLQAENEYTVLRLSGVPKINFFNQICVADIDLSYAGQNDYVNILQPVV